ncbi:hypothetical protein A8B75_11615 [Sphingomonadales bacterium EhC05]|nr:hypothetical protein A8B75_11615 [Sphingomonadales bacterium EhC05]
MEAEQSLGEILGATLRASASELDLERAQYLAALQFSLELSGFLPLSQTEIFTELSYAPESMLHLLQSPYGWHSLASYIASETGANSHSYMPTIH